MCPVVGTILLLDLGLAVRGGILPAVEFLQLPVGRHASPIDMTAAGADQQAMFAFHLKQASLRIAANRTTGIGHGSVSNRMGAESIQVSVDYKRIALDRFLRQIVELLLAVAIIFDRPHQPANAYAVGI